jgi:hypothetical protein
MHLAGEAIRRQPLGHRVGIDEGLVDTLWWRTQNAVEADGAWHGATPVKKPAPMLAEPARIRHPENQAFSQRDQCVLGAPPGW